MNTMEDGDKVSVLFIVHEWKSSKGGLSSFNRELAINLAKAGRDRIKVYCYVSKCDDSDRTDATRKGVTLIAALPRSALMDPLEWLAFPPPALPHPDVVISHGRLSGHAAYFIKSSTLHCKWVHCEHLVFEELGLYRVKEGISRDVMTEHESKHNTEMELCKAADQVVAVGAHIQSIYQRFLPNVKVEVITPGIFEEFSHHPMQNVGITRERVADKFRVLVFGRGNYESFTPKGYDIIANAIGSLGKKFQLVFVGSLPGQQTEICGWFLSNSAISLGQLTIRSNYKGSVELDHCEADLVVLPSRTEGFGLVALEALSAGVPILVSEHSGIAKALETVEGGDVVIVKSTCVKEWSKKILQLSEQNFKERRYHAMRLRENYQKTYSWSTECAKLERIFQYLVKGSYNVSQEESEDIPSKKAASSQQSIGKRPQQSNPGKVQEESKLQEASETDDKRAPSRLCSADHATVELIQKTSEVDFYPERSEIQETEDKELHLIHQATNDGNIACIEKFLSEGYDVNGRDSYGNTPLMIAALKGRWNLVNFLMKNGADALLKSEDGSSLLHFASRGGNLDVIETMVKQGIEIDLTDSDDNSSLMYAAYEGKVEVVNYLLTNGANPVLKGKYGRCSLHCASIAGNVTIIDMLLSHGVDVDSRDWSGNTSLMYAASNGKMDAVTYLLVKGADPSLERNGKNLLHFSSQGGNVTIIEKMLSHGVDINSKDDDGNVPLTIAARHGNIEAVNFLLAKGARKSHI